MRKKEFDEAKLERQLIEVVLQLTVTHDEEGLG
jgi:hypothetical protein